MEGSKPFSLATYDWIKIGKGALLSVVAALAAYTTASLLPILRESIANDSGLLIVTVIQAVAPVLLNICRKFLTDTRV